MTKVIGRRALRDGATVACALAVLLPAAGAEPLERVAALLEGTLSSAAQAQADPDNFRHVRLAVARIWKERPDGPWLYVEQAVATALDRPYRQRVYRLRAGEDGTVVSEIYTLPGDALRFAGAASDPARLADLAPEQLTHMAGCDVHLTARPDGSFAGATRGTACASTREGARYTTSEVTLSAGGMDSWDRGWDAEGKQVWGATTGPYRFRR